MHPILEIRSRCRGKFALSKPLKVHEGTLCELRRNPLNEHGRLQLITIFSFAWTAAIVDVSNFNVRWILWLCTHSNNIDALGTDSKCIQIIAPVDVASSLPYDYHLGERIGNVSHEVALVLASMMDEQDLDLPDYNIYDVGFKFQCVLLDETTHRAEGSEINIIVLSVNNESFTDSLMYLLHSKGLEPLRICKVWFYRNPHHFSFIIGPVLLIHNVTLHCSFHVLLYNWWKYED